MSRKEWIAFGWFVLVFVVGDDLIISVLFGRDYNAQCSFNCPAWWVYFVIAVPITVAVMKFLGVGEKKTTVAPKDDEGK